MKRFRLLLMFVALFNALGIWAEEANLKLHFNFENVTGNAVPEAVSGGTLKGTLRNNAKVEKMGKYHVLNLGSANGYFDMGAGAGKVMAGCTNFTISMYYYVNAHQNISGLGNFLFTFSTQETCSSSAGCYYFYTLNSQRFAASQAGYGAERSTNANVVSTKGRWVSVVYVLDGNNGTLYVDGQKMLTAPMPKGNETFSNTAPIYNWIGRSPFAGDAYLANTKVADIRIYDKALTGAEVTKMALGAEDLENAFRHGDQGDLTKLKGLLNEASTLLNGDVSEYAPDAVAMLTEAYSMIKLKSEKEVLSQMMIDEYASDLSAIIQSVKTTAGFIFTDTERMPAYDSNRGFRHPGGLHTDADFERIKAQLAAGNEKVTKAYNILKNAEYAQPTVATYPVETIIRGAGAQNYINAARGASIAYQNALRWKIEGNEKCAKHAVDVLMAWANTCKGIGGNSNYALAAGLYGYEFAQAAELMRDYKGWSAKDFESFKRWMLDVWYPSAVGFQRGRNATWENVANKPAAGWGADGDRPGHYWSNWGLCNALCLVSIGVLCDDVFIYNQGLSFVKYDLAALTGSCPNQKPTATDVWNNGLTEYMDNLIPNVAAYAGETGAYGKVGQMQESGRDQGHATMALGLAVDICQTAWNQGDDLYSYHDNRMAAGIEFTAAYNNANKDDLPWVNYHYADCRTAWHGTWNQNEPNGGGRGQTRPYWARIIGHYEGVKGVKMPFAEMALDAMGIDGGPSGGTSGAYDHMGYSVLTCTYDKIAGEKERPTLLSPRMEYDGQVIEHNELGGISSTYRIDTNMGVPAGKQVKLMPQLPEGATDTGNWVWNTGETTKDIIVSTDKSFLYRVTYTNENKVKSEQVFAIAAQGDCNNNTITSSVYCDGVWIGETEATVYYGSSVDLNVDGRGGWGEGVWSTGDKGTSLHINSVTSDREIKGQFITQGGKKQTVTFRIHVKGLQPCALLNNRLVTDSLSLTADSNDALVLYAKVPSTIVNAKYEWSNGCTSKYLDLGEGLESGDYTLRVTGEGFDESMTFHVMVIDEKFVNLSAGNYAIHDWENDTYLTYEEGMTMPKFESLKGEIDKYDNTQVWKVEPKVSSAYVKYNFISLVGGSTPYLNALKMQAKAYLPFYIRGLIGSNHVAIRTLNKEEYWKVNEQGELNTRGQEGLSEFPFEFIPVKDDQITNGIQDVMDDMNDMNTENVEYFSVAGVKTDAKAPGVYLKKYTTRSGKVVTQKIGK